MMSRLILNIVVLSSLSYIVVFGQIGSICHQDSDCLDGLQCNTILCICKIKHVQNGKYCFPVVNYDEICWFTDQCDDYRQICQNTTLGIQRCRCDHGSHVKCGCGRIRNISGSTKMAGSRTIIIRFHYYNTTVQECLVKEIFHYLQTKKYFFDKDIETASEKPFLGILGAGLAVGLIGFLGLLIAFFHCCHMRQKDKKYEKELNALIAKNGGKLRSPALASIAERNEKMNEASIGPIFGDGGMVMA